MIRSMTGFGRAETNEDGKKITVEMKSVNHRYCEISTRMPKKLNFYDSAVRQLVKKYVVRGKVDVYVSLQDDSDSGSNVKYNEAIAKEYLGYLKQMSDELGVANDVTVTSLARMPEVLVLEESESDQEKTWEQLEKTVILACENLSEMRAVEGAHLKEDIIGKLDGMVGYIDQIEKRTPEMMAAYRKKLKEKLDEVISDTNISEQLIAGELIIYSDKICVDEETVRLRTHITNMKKTLDAADNIGRKLDFLAQEMNREANTTLSKANDIEVSELAINLKTEIEKIREQIQNIEQEEPNMLHPSYTDLMNAVNKNVEPGEEPVVNSRYSIVLATAKRAKQLINGAPPEIPEEDIKCEKPLSIAVQEVYAGKVKILTGNETDEIAAFTEGTLDDIETAVGDMQQDNAYLSADEVEEGEEITDDMIEFADDLSDDVEDLVTEGLDD